MRIVAELMLEYLKEKSYRSRTWQWTRVRKSEAFVNDNSFTASMFLFIALQQLEFASTTARSYHLKEQVGHNMRALDIAMLNINSRDVDKLWYICLRLTLPSPYLQVVWMTWMNGEGVLHGHAIHVDEGKVSVMPSINVSASELMNAIARCACAIWALLNP
jgi:hypothetical protein